MVRTLTSITNRSDQDHQTYDATTSARRVLQVDSVGRPVNDSAGVDAFGRLRVSQPETIFDSKQIHDNDPLFWDDVEESGSGTSSNHSVNKASTELGVSLNTTGKRTRQTFRRFNYQPGKSQLILMTAVIGSGGGTGINARVGLFDDNNGLFFEDNQGVIQVVRRTNVTGTPTDSVVTQPNWNIDTMDGNGVSGITIDKTKTQIIVIDYEWLGVGRVRMGFNLNGITYYCHEFLNSNTLTEVYMSTPNLPLRYQLENDGTGIATTMKHICTSVISEGGTQDNGMVRYASTANTQVDCAVVGTIYGIKGLRLKSTDLDETIKVLRASIQLQSTSDDFEWLLIFKPTVAGTPSWVGETNSSVETATGATANTITGGIYITGGYIATGAGQSTSSQISNDIENALILGSTISGTPDEIWLAGRSLTSVNVLVEGSLTWRELS